MRIVLTMNLPYTRSFGGANRSNRGLCEALVRKGHSVRVVTPLLATPSSVSREQVLDQLRTDEISVASNEGVNFFSIAGIEVCAVDEASSLRGFFVRQLELFGPDWILVSSEDPSQSLLQAALKANASRVVYLAHTPQMFPFGPMSLYPGTARTDLVRSARAVVVISRFVRDYIAETSGIDADIIHFPHYGTPPYPCLAQFENPYVLLMNASQIKGISIFLGLAAALPEVRFAALPGYGTTNSDRASLSSLPNVTVLENRANLDEIFSQTRVLLMPSLWIEGFGMAVIDGMLRGIPVLASNSGGLVEAKLGTDYLLPVRPIERFEEQLDSNFLPVPVVPDQDFSPWIAALSGLLRDRSCYENKSAEAREAALRFVSGVSVDPFEALLQRLMRETAPLSVQGGTKKEPTVSGSAVVTDSEWRSLGPVRRSMLVERLRKRARDQSRPSLPAISPRSRDGDLPLAFPQQRLWFLDQLEPGSIVYNIPIGVRVKGRLQVGVMERAINDIVGRHEILRTRFEFKEGQPVQVVQPRLELAVKEIRLEGASVEERSRELERLREEEGRQPFDLAKGPLMRATVVQAGEEEYEVFFTMHHIVSDGWSMGILVREFVGLYEAYADGKEPRLKELPIQYGDYAVWQRTWLSAEQLENYLRYWREQLRGAPELLDLRTDRPRPAAPSYRGGRERFEFSKELSEELKKCSREKGVTLFMTLLAGFQVLLNHYSGQEDIVVGSPTANRKPEEAESLIGFFVNTLVLRTNLSGDPTVTELLGRVRETSLGAYEHQDLPFEKLVEELQPKHNRGYNPFFQAVFALHNIPEFTLHIAGLELEPVPFDIAVSNSEFELAVTDQAGTLRGVVAYNTDLFNPGTIRGRLAEYEFILVTMVAAPEMKLHQIRTLLRQKQEERDLAGQQELKRRTEEKLRGRKQSRRSRAPELPSRPGLLADCDHTP